jgi:transposase InsO family protein
VPRRHESRIAVQTSDARWCSEGFEFRCEDGAKLSVIFALDCCDREAIGWVASPTGYSGDDIRDLMLESVEKRFGDQLPATPVQWLSDNGSAYTAEANPLQRHIQFRRARPSPPARCVSLLRIRVSLKTAKRSKKTPSRPLLSFRL